MAFGVTGLAAHFAEEAGEKAQEKAIWPVYDPLGVMVRVYVALAPLLIVWVAGEAVKVNVAGFTGWVSVSDVLPESNWSPEYVATIEWFPIAKGEVFNVAIPPLMVVVPSVFPPSVKVTVPLGVLLLVLCTWAVKVSEVSGNAVATEEPSIVFVAAAIVSLNTPETLDILFVSPL